MSTSGESEDSHPDDQESSRAADGAARTTGTPSSIIFPPDQNVLIEARKLAGDKNIRVEDLAICAAQDPVIVLELLKVANAMFFSGGKSPITSVKTAIVRLGSDVVIETLDKMKGRQQFENEEVQFWFENQRSRCRRTSIIARILAEATTRTLSDDCQAAGLFLFVGDMLAVANFGEVYVSLAEELSKSGLNYRLAQDYKFDVERAGLSYLRRYGIPEALLFAIDREARAPSKERTILRPICFAAGEIIDAFDSNRWEKLAPGRSLPSKSSLRLLQLPDNQYLKVYERSSEYLFSARLAEEKRKAQAALQAEEPQAAEAPPQATPSDDGEAALESEIQNLLRSTLRPKTAVEETKQRDSETLPTADEVPETRIVEISRHQAPSKEEEDQFLLTPVQNRGKKAARKAKSPSPPKTPQLITPRGQKVLGQLYALLEQAQSGEQLLTDLLQMLVKDGTFEKSAIIVVSKDRSRAMVVAARGPQISRGETLSLEDPLSPLAQCFSKVLSFSKSKSKVSPWGSCAYALAPIDADHETPVALYADCGEQGPVTFEARRIFRTVVEILNSKLPQIPGGIPVEI